MPSVIDPDRPISSHMSGERVTAVEAERFLGIDRRRIARWHARGSVISRGTMNSKPRFLVHDLYVLDRKATNDPRSKERRSFSV